jgi:hypothetical protein
MTLHVSFHFGERLPLPPPGFPGARRLGEAAGARRLGATASSAGALAVVSIGASFAASSGRCLAFEPFFGPGFAPGLLVDLAPDLVDDLAPAAAAPAGRFLAPEPDFDPPLDEPPLVALLFADEESFDESFLPRCSARLPTRGSASWEGLN